MSGERKPRSKAMTAAEAKAQIDERLRSDPAYRAQVEAAEAERAQRDAVLRAAERPIIDALRDGGLDVTSVWDLVNTSDPYPDALPILLAHLQRGGYPDRVMESLARALAVRPASYSWETLRALYVSADGRGEEHGLAVALAASATGDHLDALMTLLRDGSRDSSRILLLGAIKRVGGASGLETLRSLTSDPMFGAEARALLGKRP